MMLKNRPGTLLSTVLASLLLSLGLVVAQPAAAASRAGHAHVAASTAKKHKMAKKSAAKKGSKKKKAAKGGGHSVKAKKRHLH